MIFKFADNRDPNSLASRLRARRNQKFGSMVVKLPRPLTILDVGGTETVWETVGFVGDPSVSITILNVYPFTPSHGNVSSVIGDARNMHQFREGQFEVVYSNSVIEHVGSIADRQQMAREIQRVGKRYFVQTPSRYFPIEPHFLFPFFQFLPRPVQVSLLQRFALGWVGRMPVRREAERAVDSIYLLSASELRSLFPSANIQKERVFGLTKSIIAYNMQ